MLVCVFQNIQLTKMSYLISAVVCIYPPSPLLSIAQEEYDLRSSFQLEDLFAISNEPSLPYFTQLIWGEEIDLCYSQ